jgi:hypothetical protein
MDFTGKPLRGFAYVSPPGFRTLAALHAWLSRGERVAAEKEAGLAKGRSMRPRPPRTTAHARRPPEEWVSALDLVGAASTQGVAPRPSACLGPASRSVCTGCVTRRENVSSRARSDRSRLEGQLCSHDCGHGAIDAPCAMTRRLRLHIAVVRRRGPRRGECWWPVARRFWGEAGPARLNRACTPVTLPREADRQALR